MLKPKFENKPKIKSGTKRTVPLVPKPIVPILLIISMILPLFGPVGVFAQAGNTITYTYKAGIGNEQELESIFMRINTNIRTAGNHDVTILTEEGRPQNIGRVTVEDRDIGRDIPRNFWVNNPRSNMRITSIIIGDFQLNFDSAPKINRMETYDINTGDIVSFTGE
ncbi:MAG: hypothetical protein GX968_08610, partial [Tissierellia bacterium]|nr:hypothetical protein [Tissierellia bacterium]